MCRCALNRPSVFPTWQGNSTWQQRWQQLGGLTYSTVDNSKPSEGIDQRGACGTGYARRFVPGSAINRNGQGFTECYPCPAGTYEKENRICEPAPSEFYISEPAQNVSGLRPCGERRRVQARDPAYCQPT